MLTKRGGTLKENLISVTAGRGMGLEVNENARFSALGEKSRHRKICGVPIGYE